MRIDSESESEGSVSIVSVETVGTEEDRGGSSPFVHSLGFVTMSRGIGGTGGRLCEASIGGGGGAKGGNFNWNGILRTCRNMAEACAGQMAKKKFRITATGYVVISRMKHVGVSGKVNGAPVGLVFTNRVSNTE